MAWVRVEDQRLLDCRPRPDLSRSEGQASVLPLGRLQVHMKALRHERPRQTQDLMMGEGERALISSGHCTSHARFQPASRGNVTAIAQASAIPLAIAATKGWPVRRVTQWANSP